MEMNHVLVVEDDKEIREGADGWNPHDDEASGKI